MTTTELNTEGGMHIEADPTTGAIAASQSVPEQQKALEQAASKNDQPEQTPAAEANEPQEPVDPRAAIMKNIYEGRSKQFANELEYAAGMSQLPQPADDNQQPNGEQQPEPTQQPGKLAAEPAKPAEQQPQQPVRKPYIINGQQIELTDQELATLASRSMAQTQQVIQQYQRQLQQPQQQQLQQPQQQQLQQQLAQQPQQQQELLAPDRLREIVRKITYGSEDEAVNSLRDFADRTAKTVQRSLGPTPEQIANYAAQQALAQVSFQTNLNTIASEFPDIFEKRSATLVAADYVNSLRNRYHVLGHACTDIDLYREACQLARADFGGVASKPQQAKTGQQTAVQTSQQRAERKRAAPQPAAAVARVVPQQIDKALSGSDIVNRMRSSRGQMTA